MEKTRISILLELLNISQKEFAQAIKASAGNVNDWVSGRTKPGKTSIDKICSIFDVSYDWLKYGTGEPFIKPNGNSYFASESSQSPDKTYSNHSDTTTSKPKETRIAKLINMGSI